MRGPASLVWWIPHCRNKLRKVWLTVHWCKRWDRSLRKSGESLERGAIFNRLHTYCCTAPQVDALKGAKRAFRNLPSAI